MKIGIITFWKSRDNYGQVLQCYALQKALENMGHDPYLIKCALITAPKKCRTLKTICDKILKVLMIYPLFVAVARRISKVRDNKYAKIISEKNKNRCFEEFRMNNIKGTDKIYRDIDDLRKDPPVADCYITGSDQVWRMLLDSENNKAYYLDFGAENIKRISYAASFARDFYPQHLKSLLQTQLKKFDFISVREDSGVKICNEVGFEAVKVVDPTFLLLQSDYFKLIDFCHEVKEEYFYVYSINIKHKSEMCWNGINNYALKKNLKPFVTTSSGHFPGRELFNNVTYVYATIGEWLRYINFANFVVTTSFHGVVFSLIMNTNFVYIPLNGYYSSGNDRVVSLLKSLNLESKMCCRKEDVETCIDSNINWTAVNLEIGKLRLQSLDFLINALS